MPAAFFQTFGQLGESTLFTAVLQFSLAFPANQHQLALPRSLITPYFFLVHNLLRHEYLDAREEELQISPLRSPGFPVEFCGVD
jgi:hypothetical protein